MKRNGFTLVEFVVVIGIVVTLASIIFPVFGRTHCDERAGSCQSNLKQIALGFLTYAQDYDGRLPRAGVVGTQRWASSIQPYVKSWGLFQCPTTKLRTVGKTDYFYNQNLTGARQNRATFANSTILLGDGNDDSSLNYSLSSLPKAWREQSEKTPMTRHYWGGRFVFLDGHAKGFKAEKITMDSPTGHNATFLLR